MGVDKEIRQFSKSYLMQYNFFPDTVSIDRFILDIRKVAALDTVSINKDNDAIS